MRSAARACTACDSISDRSRDRLRLPVEALRTWPEGFLPEVRTRGPDRPVSRVLSREQVAPPAAKVIPLGRLLLGGSSTLTRTPRRRLRAIDRADRSGGVPIRACSGRGLPRRRSPGCRAWALTPRFHPCLFAPPLRAARHRRCHFCCAFPRVTPGRCYRPPCPVEPGLSSRERSVFTGDLPAVFGGQRASYRGPSPDPNDACGIRDEPGDETSAVRAHRPSLSSVGDPTTERRARMCAPRSSAARSPCLEAPCPQTVPPLRLRLPRRRPSSRSPIRTRRSTRVMSCSWSS